MKMKTNFFKKQEREVSFIRVLNIDSDEPTEQPLFTIKGLVSFSQPGVDPQQATELGSMNVRMYFDKSHQSEIALLEIGDIAVVDDTQFQIKIIDNRAVRPTNYPIRIEVQRS